MTPWWSSSAIDVSFCSARRRTARGVLPGTCPHHPPSHPGARIHRGGGRGRLARRLPREPLRARRVVRSRWRSALADFQRFPSWMWRNTEVLEFVEWLRARNLQQPPEARARLLRCRPLQPPLVDGGGGRLPAGRRSCSCAQARMRYGCFDHVRPRDLSTARGLARPDGAVQERGGGTADRPASPLRRPARPGRLGGTRRVLLRGAQRTARARRRALLPGDVPGRISSWNLRDHHMADTVDALVTHLSGRDGPAKVVVWAHNSHVGDARATELGSHGELTLGQLVRNRWPDDRCWSDSPPTPDGHRSVGVGWAGGAQAGATCDGGQLGVGVPCTARGALPAAAGPTRRVESSAVRLERAIGVIYRPDTERFSH